MPCMEKDSNTSGIVLPKVLNLNRVVRAQSDSPELGNSLPNNGPTPFKNGNVERFLKRKKENTILKAETWFQAKGGKEI